MSEFEFKCLGLRSCYTTWSGFSTQLKRERRTLMGDMSARVERVSYTRNRIVNKDRLQRLFTTTQYAEAFERLLAARATLESSV